MYVHGTYMYIDADMYIDVDMYGHCTDMPEYVHVHNYTSFPIIP